MKVTNANNSELNHSPKVTQESSATDFGALPGDELQGDATSEKPSFASVLDRVTQSHREPAPQSSPKPSAGPAAHESKAKSKSDEPANAEANGIASIPLQREAPALVEGDLDVRAILPAADLEKIVAACRVQVVGTEKVVTLDLSHSVLDGLRVKVSADSAGRIATEFLAANDGVKSLLDSRSLELIALLRARGIGVASFKSSVATDTRGGNNSQPGRDKGNQLAAAAGHMEAASLADSQAGGDALEEHAIGATYRA